MVTERRHRFFALQPVRWTVLVRTMFYAVTVGAALLAVAATTLGGETGDMLMDLSWYTLMLSFVSFLLMVFVNFLAVQASPD
jgi:hypothetical protein